MIIREVDCCEGKTIPAMEIKAFMAGQETIEGLEELSLIHILLIVQKVY